MKPIILISALLFVITAFAFNGGEDRSYLDHIEEIPQQLNDQLKKECEYELKVYEELMMEYPDEPYYRFVYEKIKERCESY